MARVASTAWSTDTNTSRSEAMRSPSESPPPTSRLNPRLPSAPRAGQRPMSLISACAQSSTQPVTDILNLRGMLAYSRLPVKKAEIARATGRPSKASFASTPDTGQLTTLRAPSPQACIVVRPTAASRRQIRGMSSIWIQWICTDWRVVRSAKREPKTRLSVPSGPSPKASATTPISRSWAAVRWPPGTLIRIMKAFPPCNCG